MGELKTGRSAGCARTAPCFLPVGFADGLRLRRTLASLFRRQSGCGVVPHFDCNRSGLIPVLVDESVVLPYLKAAPDARHVAAVGFLDGIFVLVVL